MRIVIEGQRPKWVRLPRTWRMRAALSVVGLLTVSVPIAWASHDFTDVPTAHQFHSQISAIKGAGITTGCGGGNYCPDDFVRRDAMAAFMHRGFGRAAQSLATVDSTVEYSPGVATDSVIGQVAITVPGSGAGTQFVKLDAVIRVNSNTGTLPYSIYYYFSRTNCGTGPRSNTAPQTLTTAGAFQVVSHTWIAAAAPGPVVFQLCGWAATGGTVVTAVNVGINATTYPFGSTGGATLGLEAAQAGGDERP